MCGDVAVMGLHKLTAGDGYMYLIRQVAAADATERGRPSLSDYYSAKGESPGMWMGHGLGPLGRPVSRDLSDPIVADLWGVPAGSQVSEDQMKALFGEGLHPNADRITRHLIGFGLGQAGAIAAARLGRPFAINNSESQFVTRLRRAYRDYNSTVGADEHASIAADVRARLRTALGREMFTETYARPPPMTESCRVSSRAIRGRPPPPWPAMTSPSPRSNPCRRCGRSPLRRSRPRSSNATTTPWPTHCNFSKNRPRFPAWAPMVWPKSTPPD